MEIRTSKPNFRILQNEPNFQQHQSFHTLRKLLPGTWRTNPENSSSKRMAMISDVEGPSRVSTNRSNATGASGLRAAKTSRAKAALGPNPTDDCTALGDSSGAFPLRFRR